MSLDFKGSPTPSIGVEIELQVLDPKTLDLTAPSDLLIRKSNDEGLERVKSEIHQSMIEIDTEVSSDVKECREFLRSRSKRLSALATELGLELATSGTHPFQRWRERLISPDQRYQNLHLKYQWLARRMNVYGLHVHVGVKSGKLALAISNMLTKYLPHLLALSANSPFWQGLDTGMNSSRINIMESFPFGGIPKAFKEWKEFEYYYETLNRVKAISSLKDLYWHIRPNLSYGTIEFRICDAMSSLDDTMSVVALIQSLVVFAEQKIEADPRQCLWSPEQEWIAPENQWIAARDGLEGFIITDLQGNREKISESILQLIEQLSPVAKNLNCYEELQFIEGMIGRGNGAQQQRNKFKETQSLKKVVLNNIKVFKQSFVEDYATV